VKNSGQYLHGRFYPFYGAGSNRRHTKLCIGNCANHKQTNLERKTKQLKILSERKHERRN